MGPPRSLARPFIPINVSPLLQMDRVNLRRRLGGSKIRTCLSSVGGGKKAICFPSSPLTSRGAETMHNSLAMTFPLSLLSCVLLFSFPLMLHFYWHFKGVVKIHCSEFMLRPFRRYGLLPPSGNGNSNGGLTRRRRRRCQAGPLSFHGWMMAQLLSSSSLSVSHHSLGRIPPPQPLCCPRRPKIATRRALSHEMVTLGGVKLAK